MSTSDAIYPIGVNTSGEQLRATTLYNGIAGGVYVPLAGGSGVGSAMTGPLYVGNAAALTGPMAGAFYLARPDTGQITDSSAIVGENDSPDNVANSLAYGVAGSHNRTLLSATAEGAGVYGAGYGSTLSHGVIGRSTVGSSGVFQAGADSALPTLISKLEATQTAASTYLFDGQDSAGASVASIRGDGLYQGAAGIFTTQVVTPYLVAGLSGNVSLKLEGVGTGKVEVNSGFRFTAGATNNITAVGDTIPATHVTAVINPDANYTLTSTPTVADATNGDVVIIRMPDGEGNTVTVQDESVLAGSNLRLGASTRTIRNYGCLALTFNGTYWQELFYSPGLGKAPNRLSATATLDFGSTAAGTVTDLTVTVTGAASGDIVSIGVPTGSVPATGTFFGWVSAADTVTVRYANNALVAAGDPASGSYNVIVDKL